MIKKIMFYALFFVVGFGSCIFVLGYALSHDQSKYVPNSLTCNGAHSIISFLEKELLNCYESERQLIRGLRGCETLSEGKGHEEDER